MIAISKEETKLIRRYFPAVVIVRTAKQRSKRHHYYCEEDRRAMHFLKRIRNGESEESAIKPKNKANNTKYESKGIDKLYVAR